MISYEPLVKTMKERGIGIKELTEKLGRRDGGLKYALNSGEYVSCKTIDKICEVLKCRIEEVIEYREGKQEIEKVELYVYVNWEKIRVFLEKRGLDFYSASIDMGKSRSWLENKRRRGKIKRSDLKLVCNRYGITYEQVIIS